MSGEKFPGSHEDDDTVIDARDRFPLGSKGNPLPIDSRPNIDPRPDRIVDQVDRQTEAKRSRGKLWAALGVSAAIMGGAVLNWWRTYSEIDPVQRERIEAQAKNHELQPRDYKHFKIGDHVKVQRMEAEIHPNAEDGGVNVRKSDPSADSDRAKADAGNFLVESPVVFTDDHGNHWLGFVSEDHLPVGGGEYFVSAQENQGVKDLANNTLYSYNIQDPRLVDMVITGTYVEGVTAKDKEGNEQIIATAVKKEG